MESRLDESITSRQIEIPGLSIHVLQCGDPKNKMILLLHGFPELAFSWRKVIPLLARAGYFVIAPDMRGYGKTVPSGADPSANSTLRYTDGIDGFGMVDTISEVISLVYTSQEEHGFSMPVVECVIGHDMGSAVAATLALIRPDIFKRLIMMSAPFTGVPASPAVDSGKALQARRTALMDLSKLSPPRQHYQLYFCRPDANQDWMASKQGLKNLYQGYYYYKSGLHSENRPKPLGDAWAADKLTQMPEYYIMRQDSGMSETVARNVPDVKTMTQEMTWMPEIDLDVYVHEFERTGFQGGLNHYRARVSGHDTRQLSAFMGKVIEVPCCFISGACDWGNYQDPGGLDKMQSEEVVKKGCFKGVTFIDRAGHWVCTIWLL